MQRYKSSRLAQHSRRDKLHKQKRGNRSCRQLRFLRYHTHNTVYIENTSRCGMVHKSGEEVPDVHRGASFVSLKQAPSRFVCRLGLFFTFPTVPAPLRGEFPFLNERFTHPKGQAVYNNRGGVHQTYARVEETKGCKRYIKQKGRPPHVDIPLLFPYHYPLGLKRWRDGPYF